ncbi:peroxiredoxin family protein [Candidatus Latescibacterota bacterium]
MNRLVIFGFNMFLFSTVTVIFAQNTVPQSMNSENNQYNFIVYAPGGTGSFNLSDARGNWVALHFLLKTECGFCMRLTNEYISRASELPDITQVFLKPDDDEAISQWKTSYFDMFLSETDSSATGTMPVIYRDPNAQLANAFNIPGGYEFHGEVVHYPALIIINPEGEEVFRYVGESNRDRLTFDQFIVTIADLKKGGDGSTGLEIEGELAPAPGHESHEH